MKTLIICNRLSRIKAVLKPPAKHFRYLNLSDNAESFRICSYLRERTSAEELIRHCLLRERSGAFRKQYIEFVGQLNSANHAIPWWAMSFTNKDPFASSLSRNTAYFLLIADLCRSESTPLVVVTDSPELSDQVVQWANKENIDAVNLVNGPRPFHRFLKQYTPAGIVNAVYRLMILWISSRQFKLASNNTDEHVVFATHTHPRSFTASNGYRDAYFGDLVKQAAERTPTVKSLVLGLVLERPKEQFKKLSALEFNLPVLPLQSYLCLRDLLRCTLKALRSYPRPMKLQGATVIDGLDVRCLVEAEIKNSRNSGELVFNLQVYYSAKRLAQTLRVSRCLYPFENRSWEKMLILGMRDASPETRLIGYQHTSITQGHTNFMLGNDEAKTIPLPDSILTTGEVTKDWLESEGNFPAGMFKTACALRQPQDDDAPTRKQGKLITKVLVVLATSLEEYVNTLLFLEQAFADENRFDLQIRPHPSLMPLEPALEIAPLARSDFYTQSTGSIVDALQRADVVLYASSTVCLQAAALGIPTVYVDLGFHVNTDPMFGWNEFKWSVEEPSEVIAVIKQIESLTEETFNQRQQEGRDYAESYLQPVTSDRLESFWVS